MRIFNIHIITEKQRRKLIDDCFYMAKDIDIGFKFATLNPVVHSLKHLRDNTWDIERVETYTTEDKKVISDFYDLHGEILRTILDTQDKQIRDTLIQLGWTPPEDD